MEYWSNGALEFNTPTLQHSNTMVLERLRISLRSFLMDASKCAANTNT
jgi:hypothetical protein